MTDREVPAGWYSHDEGKERYWNGTEWTDQWRPEVATPDEKSGTSWPWVFGVIGLLLVGVIAMAIFGSSRDVVSADDFDQPWPLTVDEATLDCQDSDAGPAVTLKADGTEYGLNGTAQTHLDLPPIDPIWKKREDGLRVNVSPLLNRGLELCD